METKGLQLQVTAADGASLAGATIKPVGMRSKEEPGSCYGWGGRDIPGIESGTSDAAGTATITYPARCRDELTTGTVIVMVEHAEFCGVQIEVNVDAPRPIVLTRGTPIRLTASTALGIKLISLYADIVSDNRQAGNLKWQHDSTASVSSFLPDGQYMARLVGRTDDGQLHFSDPAVFTAPGAGNLEFACQLKAATSFHGILDEAVPRPIRNGWVVAHVATPKLIQNACGVFFLRWYASLDIAEDGAFSLSGLPEGTLEIVAGCDGYVSVDLSDHPVDGVRHGQVIPDDCRSGTIPMERTGDARILVLDPTGRPLPGADVTMCPNQSLGRATSIIGARHNSEDILKAKDAGALEELRKDFKMPRFWGETDAAGMVVIGNLPPGKHRVYVSSKDFDQPIEADHGPLRPGEIRIPRRENGIVIPGGAQTSMEIHMEPKGSTSLSSAVTTARRRR